MSFVIILMFIAYFAGAYQIFPIGSYGVTALDLFTLLFFIIFLKKIFWDGDKLTIGFHPALVFLLLMFFSVIISGFEPLVSASGEHINQYFKTTAHFLFLGAFTVICSIYKIDNKVWTKVIQTWMVLSLFINVFGVYQIVARAYDLPFAWLSGTNVSLTGRGGSNIAEYRQLSLHFESFFRATSIFTEPSALATFNSYILIFIVIPFTQAQKQFFKSKFLISTIFVLSLVAIFLAFSMTGIIGIILIIFGVFFFSKSKKIWSLFMVFIISTIMIIVTDIIVSSYSNISVMGLFEDRISGILSGEKSTRTTEGESFGGRIKNAENMIDIWKEHPITGTGLGLTEKKSKLPFGFSDYSILAALAEMGLIGFISFTGLFITLFIFTVKFIRNPIWLSDFSEDDQRLFSLVFYIMLLQFLINFISGNNLVNFSLWNPLAMIFAIINYSLIVRNKNVYSIILFKHPLKEKFFRAINIYNKNTGNKHKA